MLELLKSIGLGFIAVILLISILWSAGWCGEKIHNFLYKENMILDHFDLIIMGVFVILMSIFSSYVLYSIGSVVNGFLGR